MKLFLACVHRDIQASWRARADLFVSLFFFVIVCCLFPFGVGSDPQQLRALGPGVIWVSALLAALLGLPRLFERDHDNGIIDQLMLSPEPAIVWVGAKIFAHWLTTGLPVVVLAPLLGFLYRMDVSASLVLALSLLLGSPVLSLLGAIGAALTMGLRGAGALLALLIFPLFVPVLIFGVSAVNGAMAGVDVSAQFLLLSAALLAAIALAPPVCGAALRVTVS
ncbi:MAG: heme exporter protein CcmB [Rhodocyclaceae bacterium]